MEFEKSGELRTSRPKSAHYHCATISFNKLQLQVRVNFSYDKGSNISEGLIKFFLREIKCGSAVLAPVFGLYDPQCKVCLAAKKSSQFVE